MTRGVTYITAAVFGAAIGLAAPAAFAQTPAAPAADQAKPPASNDQLEDRIETKWKADAALQGADIDVEVKDGVATLTGEAHTAAQKARAARLAKVSGVTQVVNHIEVVRPGETADKAKAAANKTAEGLGTAAGATKAGAETAADKTKEGVSKAADKTKEGLGTAADKTKEGLGTAADKTKSAAKATGDAASDGWITAKVKSKYVGNKATKGSSISVSTDGGIVTLTGTVPSEDARTAAIAAAKETKGVKDVVDKLTVAPAKS